MPSLRRVSLLCILAFVLASAGPMTAKAASGNRLAGARAVLAAAKAEAWGRADAAAARLSDPLISKLLRWIEYSDSDGPGDFAAITRFIVENPGWPRQAALRKHAEAVAGGVPDAAAAAWFARHPPITTVGRVRRAEILLASGARASGVAALRAAWIGGDFGPAEEKKFLADHGAMIRAQDNVARLDRLLWRGQSTAAKRMLPRVPAGYRALARARLALEKGSRHASALIARVPARLRADPGLRYRRVRWRLTHDAVDRAAAMLLSGRDDAAHAGAWWHQRQIVAQKLIAEGKTPLAYRVVAGHGPISGRAYAEAEFLLGYIALTARHNPALAFGHFARILRRVDRPSEEARSGYWSGRAAEAEGKPALAGKWFAAAAYYRATFYGQLAAHRLGITVRPHPVPAPAASAAQRRRFDADERVRAARLLLRLGADDLAKSFVLQLARESRTPAALGLLVRFAERSGRPDLAVAAFEHAGRAGLPLIAQGYPVIALPPGGAVEHALLFAMVRQESAFDADAVSWAGARGLMQLMPATARSIAREIHTRFSAKRLTADSRYNIVLGRAYLDSLIGKFGGSYALAIAAYNAGPGRVRDWLAKYGDPRRGGIDMVDWIEMIPINETRRYVQRVLENLQVYRSRVARASRFSLVSDLAR